MTKYYPFFYHEVAFLPIQNKVSRFTLLQNFTKIFETEIKWSSIYEEIVHEDFHVFFPRNQQI